MIIEAKKHYDELLQSWIDETLNELKNLEEDLSLFSIKSSLNKLGIKSFEFVNDIHQPLIQHSREILKKIKGVHENLNLNVPECVEILIGDQIISIKTWPIEP